MKKIFIEAYNELEEKTNLDLFVCLIIAAIICIIILFKGWL